LAVVLACQVYPVHSALSKQAVEQEAEVGCVELKVHRAVRAPGEGAGSPQAGSFNTVIETKGPVIIIPPARDRALKRVSLDMMFLLS